MRLAEKKLRNNHSSGNETEWLFLSVEDVIVVPFLIQERN